MQMSPVLLIVVLFAIGIVLLVGELFLPTQGVLGVLGCGAILWGVVQAFMINQWFGLGLLLTTLIVSPFAVTAAINLWPRTPIGRKIVLQPLGDSALIQPPRVG